MKKITLSAATLALLFLSCNKEEDVKDPIKVEPVTVEAPATYKFEREGKSTVSYSGQTTRIAMAGELSSAMLNKDKTDAQLLAMFDHKEGDTDFENADLNASKKQIKSKVAASKDYFENKTAERNTILGQFDLYIGSQAKEVFPFWEVEAAELSPGYITEVGGTKKRYVSRQGVEYNQVVAKSLIGALMTDQMLNNYLSKAVLDAGTNRADNDAGTVAEGKTYTTMEHKWDEAFGYLYGAEANAEDPTLSADNFLNKYLKSVDNDPDFKGIAETIYNAFKLGRAAIVAKNYDVRDAQAEIIRENVSKVIGVRAAYYLQSGKAKFEAGNKAGAFHDLSEAIGFVHSLQYTRKPGTDAPYFDNKQVSDFIYKEILNDFTDPATSKGLWNAQPTRLQTVADAIATAFGFTAAQAAS